MVVCLAWTVILVMILWRPIFISHDSLSNNVHIWWISERLWAGEGIPLRIEALANGEALTFPYASLPWISAAVLFPILGDRVVGLWLVVGLLGTVAATFWAFPQLRRGWWAVAVLTNPALVIAPVLGQLPYLWSAALFICGIGMWRRGKVALAVVLTCAAQIVHPAVTVPVVALVVAVWLPFEERDRRWRLLGWWALSVVVSLPAIWAVLQSPVVAQTSAATQIVALIQTVAARVLVVAIPMGLVALHSQRRFTLSRATPAVISVVFVVLQWPMYVPYGMDFAWGALVRDPDPAIVGFADSGEVVAGDTYRVLSGRDGKYGLYAVAREGGVLDAEFFPEGLHRGGFSSLEQYARFLRDRRVEHVVVFDSYARHYRRSNEPEMIEEMAASGCVDGLAAARSADAPDWALYDIERC